MAVLYFPPGQLAVAICSIAEPASSEYLDVVQDIVQVIDAVLIPDVTQSPK